MPNDILKISDKRIVLAGPIFSYSLDVATQLSRQGATVIFLTPDTESAERLAQVINDEREINSRYGRAGVVPMNFDSGTAAKMMADATHAAGGIDMYVDLMNWHILPKEPGDDVNAVSAQKNFHESAQLTYAALEFLKQRKRGKIIFVFDGLPFSHFFPAAAYAVARGGMLSFVPSQAQALRQKQVQITGCKIHLSEDMLIKYFPEKTLADASKALSQEYPHLKITSTDSISKIICFLTSDLSQGITGQTLDVF